MSLRFRLLSIGAAFALSACLASAPSETQWPQPLSSAEGPRRGSSGAVGGGGGAGSDQARIEHQPVCLGASTWSAGELGETLLYQSRRVGQVLQVGYFAFWSTERPWGNNLLSYLVVPALLTDAFYSHFLYVFPGVKDAFSGRADVEGASVEFEPRADGSLNPLGGWADDGHHTPVRLSRDDLLDRAGRVVLLSDVWSHQLGAHGAARFSDDPRNRVRCYVDTTLRPMTDSVARSFRLGDARRPRRALPAWQ
jgi:hypothetical protein